jgi:hypothetical protein
MRGVERNGLLGVGGRHRRAVRPGAVQPSQLDRGEPREKHRSTRTLTALQTLRSSLLHAASALVAFAGSNASWKTQIHISVGSFEIYESGGGVKRGMRVSWPPAFAQGRGVSTMDGVGVGGGTGEYILAINDVGRSWASLSVLYTRPFPVGPGNDSRARSQPTISPTRKAFLRVDVFLPRKVYAQSDQNLQEYISHGVVNNVRYSRPYTLS